MTTRVPAAGERIIVRRKTVSPPVRTVDEAAFDLERQNQDYLLFIEAGTGQDSVLYRSGNGLRLHQTSAWPERIVHGFVPVEISVRSADRLTTDEAVSRLEGSGEPFLFYADVDTGRGRVLHRCPNGQLELIAAG